MPRTIETSYNEILSRPEFYDRDQREEYLQKRIIREILEPEVPPLPNRQQELDYLKELENEFRGDSWFDIRFRKNQAGPLRRPYKNVKQLKKKAKLEFIFNFCLGAALFSPLGVLIGRRLRKTPTGVPKMYFPQNYHRFPNTNPDIHSARYFRLGLGITCFIGGSIVANYAKHDFMKDEYYSRPDMKPSAPMVEDSEEIKKAKIEL